MSEIVVYWRGSAEVREDLLSALMESSLMVHQVRTLEELLDFLDRHDPSAIIVDGSASQREASDRIVEVGNTEALFSYPIVFIATQARKRVSLLKSRHEQLFPIDVPYRLNQVLRGILLILNAEATVDPIRVADTLNAEGGGVEIFQSEEVLPVLSHDPAAEVEESISLDVDVTDTIEASTIELDVSPSDEPFAAAADSEPEAADAPKHGRVRRKVDDNSIANRTRLKANLDPAKLSGTYGGEVFAIASHAEDFRDDLLMPERPNKDLLQRAFEAFEKMDPWAAVHARRVTFVASAMAHSLSFDKAREENVRLTCLFINWANNDDATINTRRHDVFRDSSSDSIQQVAKAFRSSAAMIRERLGDDRSSKTVELVAKMLEGDRGMSQEQKDLLAEAECVLIVELADRSCWGNGQWNPFGVYRCVRHLRSPSSMVSEPRVKGAMKRVLGESVTTHITVGNVFVSNDDLETPGVGGPRTGAGSGRVTAGPPGRVADTKTIRSVTVQIADLTPGMRLAQPLTAVDGKVVLQAETRLNQEIVYRLWQLAAVRALNKRVDIQVER